MRIECVATFLDGRDRFEAGEVRQVDDERARAFIANGWAKSGAELNQQASGDVELEVQSVKTGQESRNG